MAELRYPTYPFTPSGLRDSMKALGTTADAVARNLDAMGFKGCQAKSENCPVANYVLASVDEVHSVSVSFGSVCVWNEALDRIDIPMTEAIADFVELFDLGRFPQLEVPDGSS